MSDAAPTPQAPLPKDAPRKLAIKKRRRPRKGPTPRERAWPPYENDASLKPYTPLPLTDEVLEGGILRARQVVERTGMKLQTIKRLEERGFFPKSFKITSLDKRGAMGWWRLQVLDWLRQR